MLGLDDIDDLDGFLGFFGFIGFLGFLGFLGFFGFLDFLGFLGFLCFHLGTFFGSPLTITFSKIYRMLGLSDNWQKCTTSQFI